MRADDGVHGSTSGMNDVHIETTAQHQIKYNLKIQTLKYEDTGRYIREVDTYMITYMHTRMCNTGFARS